MKSNAVTRKIDPAVEGERDNIGSSPSKTITIEGRLICPLTGVQLAKNVAGTSTTAMVVSWSSFCHEQGVVGDE